MGQIIRCPLTGLTCGIPVTIQDKSFFLAEAEKPENNRQWRREALNTVLEREYKYKVRSALDESDVNAFTCKICEMIQTCAYGIADITSNNPNVLLELGMMIALGKAVIILTQKGQEQELKLPSDIIDKEVIPFQDYIEIMPKLRKMVESLPSPVSPPSPIEDIERIQPQLAEELKKVGVDIIKEFKESITEAKLDTISFREEKEDIPPELDERLRSLEEKLENMRGLGFATDARTASLRAHYFYNRGKYEQALDSLNWAIEIEPDDPSTFNNRGLTYRLLKKYDESLTDLNHSLELGPDDPNTLLNRGNTYGDLREYDKSLADLNHSLELRPDDPDTLVARGVTYSKLKRYDEALTDFNRSLEIKPNDPGTLYNLACVFSLRGKIDDALTYLKKAIKADEKYREMAKTDEDFDNIRDDPRFKKLMESD